MPLDKKINKNTPFSNAIILALNLISLNFAYVFRVQKYYIELVGTLTYCCIDSLINKFVLFCKTIPRLRLNTIK